MSNFKLDGDTLFAIVDPSEPTSANAISWIAKPGQGYRKVQVSKGQAATGFFDPKGTEVDKLTTTTPAFVLVGKDGTIKSLWLGFDPDGVSTFEKDIQAAIDGKE